MSAEERVETLRRGGGMTLWRCLWERLHGPVEVTPASEQRDLWARLSLLENAARQLDAQEQVEEYQAEGRQR